MISKNTKQKNGKNAKHTQHLLTQITNGHTSQQVQEVQQCKYGIYCAHLRMKGQCPYPHRKNHYHFLNMIAPQNCLQDEPEDQAQLSKKEKKERKIIQKTINKEIDIGELDRKQNILKNKQKQQNKKQLIAQLDPNEQKTIQLVQSKDVSDYFSKLNTVLEQQMQVCQIRKKSLIQLKKKNQKLFIQIIDKEYRIANRLIKERKKNKNVDLLSLYTDINHNSIEQVRDYFQNWFIQDKGIPQEKQEGKLELSQNIYVEELLDSILKTEPTQYQNFIYYTPCSQKQLQRLKSNVYLWNLMVPFKIHKQMNFLKYLYLDCEDLSFLKLSQILLKDFINSLYTRFKAPPEFSFGQLEQNILKFTNWASKIANKYNESGPEWKLVIFLNNTQDLFSVSNRSEFEQEKLKEKRQLLTLLPQIFPLTYLVLTKKKSQVPADLLNLLQLEEEQLTELPFK